MMACVVKALSLKEALLVAFFLAGLVVLGWLLWRVFTQTDGLTTLPLAAAVVMFLSFDVLANASSLGLFVVLLGLTRRRALDEGSVG